MPYKVVVRGKKFCVINKETGDTKGCSPTRKRALAHMRALYHAESGREFTRRKK